MAEAFQFVVYGLAALTAIVHLILAYAIWVNAAERERDQKPLMYLGSGSWGLVTLLSGIFGLLVYWLVHHSALRKLYGKDDEPK